MGLIELKATREFIDPYTGRTVLEGHPILVRPENVAFMLNAGLVVETESRQAPERRGGKRKK